jgi:hypothetical protein
LHLSLFLSPFVIIIDGLAFNAVSSKAPVMWNRLGGLSVTEINYIVLLAIPSVHDDHSIGLVIELCTLIFILAIVVQLLILVS